MTPFTRRFAAFVALLLATGLSFAADTTFLSLPPAVFRVDVRETVVRKGPGLDQPIVGTLARDAKYVVHGKNATGTWRAIWWKGGRAWFRAAQTVRSWGKGVRIAVDGLAARSAPDGTSAKIGTAARGQIYVWTGTSGMFRRVAWGGRAAWFRAEATGMSLLGTPPRTIRFITQNVDFALTQAKWNSDIDAIADHSEVLMLQEAKDVSVARWIDAAWRVHQDMSSESRAGSAVAWRLDRSKTTGGGITMGVDPGSQQMLARWIVWNDLVIDGGRTIRVASVHLPPMRYRSLYPTYARHIAEFANKSPYPLVIGGDWNWLIDNNPGDLAGKTGMRFVGFGIDGFLVERSLTIRRVWEEPKRWSDHRGVGVEIEIRR